MTQPSAREYLKSAIATFTDMLALPDELLEAFISDLKAEDECSAMIEEAMSEWIAENSNV